MKIDQLATRACAPPGLHWPAPAAAAAEPAAQAGAALARQPGQAAEQALQFNRDASLQQVALDYLGRLEERAVGVLQTLAARRSASAESALQGARAGLERTLEQRAAGLGEVLDGQLRAGPATRARVQFEVAGLASLRAVQAAGAETLLFSVGPQAGGPLAVVLDEHLGPTRLLRRFNASLGQAGVQVRVEADSRLLFEIDEAAWPALREHLAIRGEGRLFAATGWQAPPLREQSLQAELRQAPGGPVLRALGEQVLERVRAAREYFQQQQSQLRQQLGGETRAAAEKRRVALDFVERLNDAKTTAAGASSHFQWNARAASVNRAIARSALTRRSVLGLLA